MNLSTLFVVVLSELTKSQSSRLNTPCWRMKGNSTHTSCRYCCTHTQHQGERGRGQITHTHTTPATEGGRGRGQITHTIRLANCAS